MRKFELLTSLAVTAYAKNWTEDLTKCNLYRLIDQECPEDDPGKVKRFTIIPGTQRVKNEAGFALDITPWSTKTQFWIKMEAYTPVLETNSVFEMYTSVLDEFDPTKVLYDTVKCSSEYWGTQQADTVNNFTVEDYQSSRLFYDEGTVDNAYSIVGNNQSSLESYKDTENEGTSDWYLSLYADENKIDCNDYYCKVTCVMYRN